MLHSPRSYFIATCVMLATLVSSPAYSQKILADGIKDLATQIATNVSKEKKQKIAILPFRELDGKPTILGTYVSEELVTDLFMIGGLDIVERTMLDRLLGEIKLGQTGVLDPDTAKRVGKVAERRRHRDWQHHRSSVLRRTQLPPNRRSDRAHLRRRTNKNRQGRRHAKNHGGLASRPRGRRRTGTKARAAATAKTRSATTAGRQHTLRTQGMQPLRKACQVRLHGYKQWGGP